MRTVEGLCHRGELIPGSRAHAEEPPSRSGRRLVVVSRNREGFTKWSGITRSPWAVVDSGARDPLAYGTCFGHLCGTWSARNTC